MKQSRIRHALWLAGLPLLLCVSTGAFAQTVLKLGHVSSKSGPIGVGVSRFVEALDEASDGAIKVQVIGGSALGGINEHWAQLRAGSLDMTAIDLPAIALMKEARFFSALSLPFLFRDRDHLHQYSESALFKTGMAQVEKATGIHFVGHLNERSPRVVSTVSRPVTTVSDLKGLKIRVPPAPILMKTFSAWGAIPTPTKPADMFMALKTGLVDGNEVDVMGVARGSTIKVVKHMTPVNYTRATIGSWISGAAWDRLSSEERGWLLQAAKQAGVRNRADYPRLMAEAMQLIKDAGITVHQPELSGFTFVSEKIDTEMAGKIWPKKMVSEIKALK